MVRKPHSATVILILTAIIAGCASTGQRAPRGSATRDETAGTETPASSVEVGMTKVEVRRLWGDPKDISPLPGEADTEIWTYEFRKAMAGTQGSGSARAVIQRTIYRLTFVGDTVTSVDQTTF